MTGGRIAVFAGPSLYGLARPADPRLVWHGPAGAGDLLALLDDPPGTLVLVDGVFGSARAVMHKEILLLMARGVRVVGGASMGALRAVELRRFGMVPVGAIARAYGDGRLTGDDEVALDHAPAALGWRPLTVPMVDIRAALNRAVRAGDLAIADARVLRDRLHSVHFAERTPACVARIAGPAIGSRLDDPAALPKELDALACIATALGGDCPAPPPLAVPMTCFIAGLAAEQPR